MTAIKKFTTADTVPEIAPVIAVITPPDIFFTSKSFKKFIITMLIIVILVEILQFVLLTGSCDIDDVILNVAGACIAYKILNVKIIKNLISKITTL